MKKLKKLDPRLRRIIQTLGNDDAMRTDIARGVTASSEELETLSTMTESSTPEPVQTSTVTKRVIVELSSNELPEDMRDWNWVFVTDHIYTVEVPIENIGMLSDMKGVKTVEAGRKWYPLLDSSVAESKITQIHALTGNLSRTGRGVVVGIVDYGMDFTMDDFRDESGQTRIASLWDQSLVPQAGEASPANFGYGVEYDATAIQNDVAASNNFSIVRHSPGVASHGTHVASTAAGNGRSGDTAFPANRYVGAAPESTIIFVQPDTRGNSGSFTDSSNVADAIAYVFARADELGMPCVINMSLGQSGGSHDGESLVERAIDRLLEPNGRAFVSAAGNEHIWRNHASGQLAGGETRTLEWRFGGGMPIPGTSSVTDSGVDRTANELEIWYSSRDRFSVTLRSPGGEVFGPVPTDGDLFSSHNGMQVFIDSERFSSLNGDARIYIEVAPSSFFNFVESGVWDVEIEAVDASDGKFDAWIERDSRQPSQNQSFFFGTSFDPVKTLGTPATARRGISVANYAHQTLDIASSSSRGRTRDGRNKPEIAAPGTDIVAAASLGGRDNGSGSEFPMRYDATGTSMSAPHVAGAIALLLEEDPALSSAQIKSLLVASADPVVGSSDFDVAWGFGRLNALQALNLLRNPDQPGRASGSS